MSDDRALKMYKPPPQLEDGVSETRALKMYKEQPPAKAAIATSDFRNLSVDASACGGSSVAEAEKPVGIFYFAGHGKENDKKTLLVRRCVLPLDLSQPHVTIRFARQFAS